MKQVNAFLLALLASLCLVLANLCLVIMIWQALGFLYS